MNKGYFSHIQSVPDSLWIRVHSTSGIRVHAWEEEKIDGKELFVSSADLEK